MNFADNGHKPSPHETSMHKGARVCASRLIEEKIIAKQKELHRRKRDVSLVLGY